MSGPRMIRETVRLNNEPLVELYPTGDAMNLTDHQHVSSKATEAIADALATIAFLNTVRARITTGGVLDTHIEWAKEAVWAAAYPGGHDDSLLNGLEAAADQVG